MLVVWYDVHLVCNATHDGEEMKTKSTHGAHIYIVKACRRQSLRCSIQFHVFGFFPSISFFFLFWFLFFACIAFNGFQYATLYWQLSFEWTTKMSSRQAKAYVYRFNHTTNALVMMNVYIHSNSGIHSLRRWAPLYLSICIESAQVY